MKQRFAYSKVWQYTNLVYAVAAAAALLMLIISYKTSLSLSEGRDALLIRMSVTLPELVIWAIALRAAVKFKQYVVSIRHSEDGKGLVYIANGLLLLVAYIITLTLGSLVVRYFGGGPRLLQAVAINNYLPLAIALLSSIYLYRGSRRLASLVGSEGRDCRRELRYVVPFVVFVTLFVVNFYANAAGLKSDGNIPRFAFSTNVLMVSYVLPYIIMWSLGLLACVNLAWYSYNSPGMLYKRLFRNFYQGILVIIISLFAAQVITVMPLTMEVVSFDLVVVYSILVLAVSGFALVYRGTLKLEKLEVVT